jgi:uncharacterized membrane protein
MYWGKMMMWKNITIFLTGVMSAFVFVEYLAASVIQIRHENSNAAKHGALAVNIQSDAAKLFLYDTYICDIAEEIKSVEQNHSFFTTVIFNLFFPASFSKEQKSIQLQAFTKTRNDLYEKLQDRQVQKTPICQ